jgi:hypothetical protein
LKTRQIPLKLADRGVSAGPNFGIRNIGSPSAQVLRFRTAGIDGSIDADGDVVAIKKGPHPRVTARPLSLEEFANGSARSAADDKLCKGRER